MSERIVENYLADAVAAFRNYKLMAERAIGQLSDEEFFRAPDEASNPIAVIVKHIAGNQRSRWRDFLTTDGEKPDRDRDSEFELEDETRESLLDYWEEGWRTLLGALEALSPADLGRTVTIRGEAHTVVEAINRQLTHYAYHVGQIVYLAKHFRSTEWRTLSVPKGRSAEFNRFLENRKAAGVEKTHPLAAPQEFADEQEKQTDPTEDED